jgi:hypothetical protein
VLHDLVEVAAQHACQLSDVVRVLIIGLHALQGLLQLIDQFDGNLREVVDEIERFLISCAMPAVS